MSVFSCSCSLVRLTCCSFVDAKKKGETLLRIRNARQRVRSEIEELSERLRLTQENIQRLRQRAIDQNYLPETATSSTNEMDQ